MLASARSRVDTLPLIAGSAVLDLVNTVSWRGTSDRQEDHLASTSDCLIWALRTQVITADERDLLQVRLGQHPEAGATLISGLLQLRDVVADVALEPRPSSVSTGVRTAVIDALSHGELVRRHDGERPATTAAGYRWVVTAVDEHTPRRRLAVDLLDLLSTSTRRIGVCADHECQWVFLDGSRAQNRRWCSSADCGNRHRVQQHQRRGAQSPGQH